MTKTQQKYYFISNNFNDFYVLASSFLNMREFSLWICNLVRSGIVLNCPIFSFCKKYRSGFNIEKIGKSMIGASMQEVLADIQEIEDNTPYTKWIGPNSDYFTNQHYNAPANILLYNTFPYRTEQGRAVIPCQIVRYNGEGEQTATALLYNRYGNEDAEDVAETFYDYDTLEECHMADKHTLESFYDSYFYKEEEEEEEEEDEPLPVHHHGFCNICYEDDKGLVHMPNCDCLGQTDFTFLCTDCQPNLNKCPQCQYHY
jgi:hypothetical protein